MKRDMNFLRKVPEGIEPRMDDDESMKLTYGTPSEEGH